MRTRPHTLGSASGSQTRREFLRVSTSAACLGALGASTSLIPPLQAADAAPASTAKALVGCNVYVWTQFAAREKKTLNPGEVLSALRDCGYDYLEFFMNVARPDENAKIAAQMKEKGLQPFSLYTGARLHEADKAKQNVARLLAVAKVCQAAGFSVISCNPDPIGREKTDVELKTQIDALTELGEGLNDLGMRLGIHHHMPEMRSNGREFHANFRNTKPEVVGFCYDVHWVWKGGVMPMDALKEYGNRIVTWHLRQSRNNIWLEKLDTGDIDYEAIAKYAKENNLARRFTVEMALEKETQVTLSAVESHRASREFVRKIFGV